MWALALAGTDGSELLNSPRLPLLLNAGLPERDWVGVRSASERPRPTTPGLDCALMLCFLSCCPAFVEGERPGSIIFIWLVAGKVTSDLVRKIVGRCVCVEWVSYVSHSWTYGTGGDQLVVRKHKGGTMSERTKLTRLCRQMQENTHVFSDIRYPLAPSLYDCCRLFAPWKLRSFVLLLLGGFAGA